MDVTLNRPELYIHMEDAYLIRLRLSPGIVSEHMILPCIVSISISKHLKHRKLYKGNVDVRKYFLQKKT